MKKLKFLTALLCTMALVVCGCSSVQSSFPGSARLPDAEISSSVSSVDEIDLSNSDNTTTSISISGGEPDFSESKITTVKKATNYLSQQCQYDYQKRSKYEYYAELDDKGRCGTAWACLGKETQPHEKRGNISKVKPSGWKQKTYNGEVLYNRCHLIGFQLAGENANNRNLVTGTAHMNVEGMLPYEDEIDDYIDSTGNHVLYSVTPVFNGDNLVASGVQMQAQSIEDDGAGVSFNVYCYNVQPGIQIDYTSGESRVE